MEDKRKNAEDTRKDFEAIYEKLKAPFKDEAYSVDNSRGFNLTSIKAQYVVERLNEVLGVNGWAHTGDYTTTDDGVLFFGTLTINNGMVAHQQQASGFSTNKKNSGDAYKGAKTDSLSKAASLFGLGNEVFKGNVPAPVKDTAKFAASKKWVPKKVVGSASTKNSLADFE